MEKVENNIEQKKQCCRYALQMSITHIIITHQGSSNYLDLKTSFHHAAATEIYFVPHFIVQSPKWTNNICRNVCKRVVVPIFLLKPLPLFLTVSSLATCNINKCILERLKDKRWTKPKSLQNKSLVTNIEN